MKKTIGILFVAFLCLTLSPASLAAESAPFQNAAELMVLWYDENDPHNPYPYPEYINGVWSRDGSGDNLCFSLVEGTPESFKEEILSLIVDKNSVTFVEGGPYTIRELYAIQTELDRQMEQNEHMYEETGINTLGISQREGVLVIGIDTENPNAQAVMEEYTEKYGDRIRFEHSEGAVLTVMTVPATVPTINFEPLPLTLTPEPKGSPLSLLLAGALFVAAIVFLWLGRRSVAQTTQGDTVSVTSTLTTRQVETALRKSVQTPDDGLYQAILDKLDG